MRTREGVTWRQLAEPIVFLGCALGMVPFMMLLSGPPETINRPVVWVIFGVWTFALSMLWLMGLYRSIVASHARAAADLRRERTVYLEERRRTRDALQRRLARIREAG